MNNRGFTLIELLAVVVILGVLIIIAFPKYVKALEKSRASGAVAVLGTLARSQSRFRFQTGAFTNDVADLDISIKDEADNSFATGSSFEDKFFTFEVSDDEDNPISTATRKGVSGEEQYVLTVNYDEGRIICTPEDHYVCKYIGVNN
jgi:prepilin-type N-terminal cleavage/methylation domain